MNHRLLRVITPLVCVALMSSLAYGQVTTSLVGNRYGHVRCRSSRRRRRRESDDTGTTFTAVTNDRGIFTHSGDADRAIHGDRVASGIQDRRVSPTFV